MSRIVLTDTGGLDFTPGIEALENAGHTVDCLEARGALSVDALREAAKDADAIITSYRTIDADTIARARGLRVIATTTTGIDQVDVDAARAAGVAAVSLPSPASEEVATHALAGMLMLLRELPAARQASHAWDFTRIPTPPRISTLTLGIVGMGRIAHKLAERALPLFGRVIAYDPYVLADAWPEAVQRTDDLDGLFAASNVVSLHIPATIDSLHLVNERTLALMPSAGYLVNVSRGELVDTAALIAAIDSGQLRAAFLDVTAPEPPEPQDPILHHPRIFVTPHAAFYSTTTERAYVMRTVENVLERLAPVTSAERQA